MESEPERGSRFWFDVWVDRAAEGAECEAQMYETSDWSQIETEATKAGVDRFMPKPLFTSDVAECSALCMGIKDKPEEPRPHESAKGLLSGKRIMLVEDVEINREIVLSLLENTGLMIDCADNGAVACDLFARHMEAYDLILMDVQMPRRRYGSCFEGI